MQPVACFLEARPEGEAPGGGVLAGRVEVYTAHAADCQVFEGGGNQGSTQALAPGGRLQAHLVQVAAAVVYQACPDDAHDAAGGGEEEQRSAGVPAAAGNLRFQVLGR